MRIARAGCLFLVATLGVVGGCRRAREREAPTVRNLVEPDTVQALLERRHPVKFVPGEIIVKKKAAAGVAEALPQPRLRQLGVEVRPVRTSGGEEVYRLTPALVSTMTEAAVRDRTMAAVEALRAQPQVAYAQPNYVAHIANKVPSDTDYPLQWHYFERGSATGQAPGGANLPGVWDTNIGGTGVHVAVIDTGILPDHPDIAGSPNLATGFDMISDTTIANDGDGRDADPRDPGDAVAANECGPGEPAQPSSWHGTHVAGTIGVGRTNNASGLAGINWDVRVHPVRVLGKCGGTMLDINDGIRWAAGLPVPGVPSNTTPAKVINMSLGASIPCTSSPSTQSAINDAVANGAIVVVAAGNEAQDVSGTLPGGCDNVISVAASDFRGNLVTRYSNFGPRIDIMAPGGDVRRDDNHDGHPDGVLSFVQGGAAFYNGTSMAAPHVAGVVALMAAKKANLTHAEALSRLKATAIARSATECPQPCGAGLLNAFAPALIVELSPTAFDLKTGGTAALTVTVTKDGAPRAGETVALSSDNTAVASIAPASQVTDSSGKATATVSGVSAGETKVKAAAQDGAKEAPVKVTSPAVPATSTAGFLLLVAVVLFLVYRRGARAA